MSASNSWGEFATLFCNTRQAFLDHERSKAELKALMPEDAKEAVGHGVRAKRHNVEFRSRAGHSGTIAQLRSHPTELFRSGTFPG